MPWIEEERKKKLQERERIIQEKEEHKLRAKQEEEERKLRAKHIEDFLNKILEANNNLPPDFKLEVENNRFIIGKNIYLRLDGDVIYAVPSSRVKFNIYYDLKKQKLLAKRDSLIYELDEGSTDILLRNLSTGRDITDGLKLYWRYIFELGFLALVIILLIFMVIALI